MTVREEKLVKAYATLVMGGRKTIDEVPPELKGSIEMEIAEREIMIIENQ